MRDNQDFSTINVSDLKGEPEMSLTNFYRLSAGTAMLRGVFIITKKLFVELFLPLNVATNAVGTMGLLLSFFSLTGLYLYQREALGR